MKKYNIRLKKNKFGYWDIVIKDEYDRISHLPVLEDELKVLYDLIGKELYVGE